MDRLVLIDGYSLMHRAFYAIPALSKDGVYTNALFGFWGVEGGWSALIRVSEKKSENTETTEGEEHP